MMCRVFLWPKSWIFYQLFLTNIPKCDFFYTPYHITHMIWLNPVILLLLITCHNMWNPCVWEKVESFLAICNKCSKNSFSDKKWNVELIKTLSCEHSNYLSQSVECLVKKLNILVITFEKYLKMWLFYPVQQVSYVSLSYFTANHSFIPNAGMHPVFPPKVTNVNTCPQWCWQCRWYQWHRWLQQGDWYSIAEGFQLC